jgi:sugar diacid utilization regulator
LGFSTKDLLLLETIEKYVKEDNWLVMTAQELRIRPVTVRIKLYRMRLKFQRAENFIQAYKKWRETLFRKSGGRWRHL